MKYSLCDNVDERPDETPLCGNEDEDGCCVCVRPKGHPKGEGAYCWSPGYGEPIPDDVHKMFRRNLEHDKSRERELLRSASAMLYWRLTGAGNEDARKLSDEIQECLGG